MKHILLGVVVVAACVMVSVTDALAQRAGQMGSIRYGTVVGMQIVELKVGKAGKGVLVGGAFGAALTKKSSSKTKRRQNAMIGAALGGIAAASKKKEGRRYSVRTNDGTVIQILTEQTGIRVDDCVIIEEVGGSANIRRTAMSVCDDDHRSAMNSPEIKAELRQEAAECVYAKEGLVNAETDEQMDFAVRKIHILCYN